MHKKVEEYLEKKRAEAASVTQLTDAAERERIKKEKAEILKKAGLYEKIYAPDQRWSEEYPNQEWDPVKEKNRYYKAVLFPVTDEEFEEIKKYEQATDASQSAEEFIVHIPKDFEDIKKPDAVTCDLRRLAKTWKTVGLVLFWIELIVGCIAGLALGEDGGIFVALTAIVAALYTYFSFWVISLLLCALAHIVQNTKTTADILLLREKNK